MSLGAEQEFFARKVPRLLDHVHSLGLEIRLGDLFRDPRSHGEMGVQGVYGHKNSCHKLKLAIDLNLSKNGSMLEGAAAEAAHNKIHDWWDGQGGAKRIPNDLNHYSMEHGGFR